MAAISLAEQLARQFANSAPVFSDPEDDIGNETAARVTQNAVDDENTDNSRSVLRKRSALLLADEDDKYAGVTVSRKSLLSGGDEDEDSDIPSGGDEVGLSDDDRSPSESDEMDYEFTDNINGVGRSDMKVGSDIDDDDHGGDEDSNYDDDNDDDDDDDDDEEENSYYDQFDMDLSAFAKASRSADASGEKDKLDDTNGGENEESDAGVTTLNRTEAADDVKRGQAVQNQIKLWESLLELRIELQKLLTAGNQLPQHDVWPQLLDSGDTQRLTAQQVTQVDDSCTQLTTELWSLQAALGSTESPESDEKHDLQELEKGISEQFSAAQVKRDDIIQKWDDKTRLGLAAASKRKGADHTQQSTLKQIEHILSDRNRLLLRTRQRRNNIHIIGKRSTDSNEASVEPDDGDEKTSSVARTHATDTEIFNDDDFYHHLLRELIEQRTNKSDDPMAMSRQWLQFQALRKKIKRTIDTRASKGRKLRYNVMPKLVNFMAPIVSAEEWDDDRKDELFASLFDKKPEYKVIEKDEPSDVVILA